VPVLPEVPNWLAGTLTIAALIGGGVFLYPWLLGRRFGALAVAAGTVLLALLFRHFDRDGGALSTALALLWAAAPVAVGVIVHRLQRR